MCSSTFQIRPAADAINYELETNTMINPIRYGSKPFDVVVVHGGPGATGEMAPVARELSSVSGVLEPLQTAASVEGQVTELHNLLNDSADLPITLLGWSWGATLSFIYTAHHPSSVSKLLLISSPPLEVKYADNIMKTRLSRLSQEERAEILSIIENLNDPATRDKNTAMSQLGTLLSKADDFDTLPTDNEVLECRYDIYENVWKQATELRSSEDLLELGKKIRCPVIAIHGDYDPHPAAGVEEPLSRVVKNFRFVLLEDCGHHPWLEKAARHRFYDTLKSEIAR